MRSHSLLHTGNLLEILVESEEDRIEVIAQRGRLQ